MCARATADIQATVQIHSRGTLCLYSTIVKLETLASWISRRAELNALQLRSLAAMTRRVYIVLALTLHQLQRFGLLSQEPTL